MNACLIYSVDIELHIGILAIDRRYEIIIF